MNPYGLGIKSKCQLPHNTYIEAAAELGVTGFIIYIWIALFIFFDQMHVLVLMRGRVAIN